MVKMSEYIFIASRKQTKVWADPRFNYEPAPFHGTSIRVTRREPTEEDPFTKEPFKRFRREH